MGRRQSFPLLRARLEARIEEMIGLLDELDGDPDYEDGGDTEPSFGHGRYHNGKVEHDLEDDTSDYEHELGWSTPRFPGEPCNPAVPTSYLPEGWSCSDVHSDEYSVGFKGDGQRIARRMLQKLRS